MKYLCYILLIFLLLFSCKNELAPLKQGDIFTYLDSIEISEEPLCDKTQKLDSIFQRYVTEPNTFQNREILFKVSAINYNLGLEKEFFLINQKIKERATIAKDPVHLAKVHWNIGDYFEDIILLDSAYTHYSKAEKLFTQPDDSFEKARMHLYKAGILFEEGVFDDSEVEAVKALSLLENSEEKRLIYDTYVLIGNILEANLQYEEAIQYHEKAFLLLKEIQKNTTNAKDIFLSRAAYHNNIGYLYNNLKHYNTAEKHLVEGLKIVKKHLSNRQAIYARLLNNLANTKIQQQKLKEAAPLLATSFQIRKNLEIPQGLISSHFRYGEYYLASGELQNAIIHWEEAYHQSKEINAYNSTLNSLKKLSLYHPTQKQKYTQEYHQVNDSIRKVRIESRVKFARIEYETQQIEKINQSLLKTISYIYWISFGSVLILVLICIIIYLRNRNRKLSYKRQLQKDKEVIYKLLLQQEQISHHTLQEERNRMSRDLHDGVVNSLFMLKLNLETNDTEQNTLLIHEIEETQDQIRKIAHNLQDQNIISNSFTAVLRELVEKQNNSHTKFTLQIAPSFNWNNFDYDFKINCYRFIQEALQNVNKHAKATECYVSIYELSNEIIVQIRDNGKGFNINKSKKGIGLRNMHHRIQELKGILEIDSTANGTVLTVRIQI